MMGNQIKIMQGNITALKGGVEDAEISRKSSEGSAKLPKTDIEKNGIQVGHRGNCRLGSAHGIRSVVRPLTLS